MLLEGSSGSGKTTLIDCLSGRKSVGILAGQVFVNNEPKSYDNFKWISGYVMQHDTHYPTLTVQETLMFAANVLLSESRAVRVARVETAIRDLGLVDVQHSFVGEDMKRGISGGEKKRVSIAIQLIHNPPILFLDEPTTGLDAFNSLILMKKLKDVAIRHQRCIITSIHQPRTSLFEMFDDVMILSKGESVYFGSRHDALNEFAKHGCACPSNVNPADFVIDTVVSSEMAATGIEVDASVVEGVAALKESLKKALLPKPPQFSGAAHVNVQEEYASSHGVNFFRQLYFLTGRAIRTTLRNPFSSIAALSQAVLFSLFLGASYFNLSLEQRGIQDRYSLLCGFHPITKLTERTNLFYTMCY